MERRGYAIETLAPLIGRLLIASLFLSDGIIRIGHFGLTASVVADQGVPWPQLAAAIAILVDLAGGAALIAGFGTRWAALVLAIETLTTALIVHDYWTVPLAQRAVEQIHFFKDIAVVGGLLALICYGAGPFSVDRYLETRQPRRHPHAARPHRFVAST